MHFSVYFQMLSFFFILSGVTSIYSSTYDYFIFILLLRSLMASNSQISGECVFKVRTQLKIINVKLREADCQLHGANTYELNILET